MPSEPSSGPVGAPVVAASGPERRLAVLNVVIAAAAAVVFVVGVAGLRPPESGLSLPWWALAAGFAVTEVFVVHVEFRRSAHGVSLSEVPLVVGLFFTPPGGLVAARVVGSALTLALQRRQPVRKVLFNLAVFALETALVIVVFHAVGRSRPLTDADVWAGATFAATLAATGVSTATVAVAMSLAERRPQARMLAEVFAAGLFVSVVANTSLALVAVVVLLHEVRAVLLLAVVAGVLFLAYREYNALRQRYASVRLLYDFTKVAGRSLEVEPMVLAMLHQACAVLGAERADVTLFDPAQDGAVRMSLGQDGRLRTTRFRGPAPDDLRAVALRTGHGLLAPRPTRDPEVAARLQAEGLSDAVVAPLHSESGPIGTMLVGERPADVATFDQEHLKLLETLANHASVSIANARLVERLHEEVGEREHQALHDALTGLPNRTLFHHRVQEAIEATGSGVAVVLIDLDRFKEVNDTLGHPNGDLVLQAVSGRLQRGLGQADTIARLGGDEFAVLLADAAGPAEVSDVAEQILRLFDEPLVLGELTLDVAASMGIARYPADGVEANTLLQRADVAMYTAKAAHTRYELYSPERDHYSPERLTLAAELRTALDLGSLVVHYQPKADLASGAITGVEALVRWAHPQRGAVPPDDFIAIAEQTGLIRPLTTHVLRTALEQCRAWRAAGWDVAVAVNLSVRSLLDVDLPDDVARLVDDTGVPAGCLTLEITESSIMVDPARTLCILSRLNLLGVGLAIDDFGTGYSSLSYLKGLPVTEVKIDKSFVMNMASDDDDAVIVRSTVDLGHNLGLKVVAEGVEDEECWNRLADLGCDVAQGYYLSRPAPASAMEGLFAVRRAGHPVA